MNVLDHKLIEAAFDTLQDTVKSDENHWGVVLVSVGPSHTGVGNDIFTMSNVPPLVQLQAMGLAAQSLQRKQHPPVTDWEKVIAEFREELTYMLAKYPQMMVAAVVVNPDDDMQITLLDNVHSDFELISKILRNGRNSAQMHMAANNEGPGIYTIDTD